MRETKHRNLCDAKDKTRLINNGKRSNWTGKTKRGRGQTAKKKLRTTKNNFRKDARPYSLTGQIRSFRLYNTNMTAKSIKYEQQRYRIWVKCCKTRTTTTEPELSFLRPSSVCIITGWLQSRKPFPRHIRQWHSVYRTYLSLNYRAYRTAGIRPNSLLVCRKPS